MVSPKLKSDLKKLAKLVPLEKITSQLSDYEKKVKEAVTELSSKSQDARKRGLQQIEKFTDQLHKTKAGVEKQLRSTVQKEGQKLKVKWEDIRRALKTLSSAEVMAAKPKKKSASKKTVGAKRAKASTPAKKKVSAPKPRRAVQSSLDLSPSL